MKIALVGNPNSGKTTLFNGLTGNVEQVGNWHGVTVEKKVGELVSEYNRNNNQINIVDLPGAYSMNPYTNEENVTSEYILEESPDVIINIIESTNLNRSLYFTTQLLELGIPVVIALNKVDLLKKKDIKINIGELGQELNCQVVPIQATNKEGFGNLINACILSSKSMQKSLTIEGLKKATTEKEYEKADRVRYKYINELVSNVERKQISPSAQTFQDKIDRVVANKWLGIPIFALVIYLLFTISQVWVGPIVADFLVALLEQFQAFVSELFGSVNPFISALLVDGIIGGVIAVIGFLPLIMVMFFLMALLEDCGYMARVAVVMDRFFQKIGLSGKSIIPMIVGTACGIPGVMASRTIKNERQRRTTAMLTPFMPCGAKLPIIALFSGVFFAGNAWIGTLMYFLAIGIIIISAIIIREITGDTSKSHFIMELPEYRIPSLKRATLSMLARGKAFIVKASTVILISNAIVQIMQSFTWSLTLAENANDSILASVATPFAIILIPLGFGMWQFAAAAVTGLIAKENVVGTLAVVFGISNFINVDDLVLISGNAQNVQDVFAISSVAGLSFLVFNLFTPPCFACIGAIRAEVNSTKWTFGAIGFQLAVGYVSSFLVYQIGTIVTTSAVGSGFIPGLIVVIGICMVIVYLMKKPKNV